ncbi:MAG: hypothetical protein N4A44_01675, partial [Alphaproteobacteria bacterium]|nr:hypothetical protein [Alphaproteobacteria bacterium]
IEMLGVLGIMAVITVLAITAYKMAYKNSKMNVIKSDISSIAQKIRKSYVNTGYTETGTYLGTDRTFDNMFVDTGLFKSSVTPFGGAYTIEATSKDLYEIGMGPMPDGDCKYVTSDNSFLKKIPEAKVACTGESGVIYYAGLNVNQDGTSTNEGSSGGDDTPSNENPYPKPKMTDEIADYMSSHDEWDARQDCIWEKSEVACSAYLLTEDLGISHLHDGCNSSPYHKKEFCMAAINHPGTSGTLNMSACRASGEDEAICKKYFDEIESEDAPINLLTSACTYPISNSNNACDRVLDRQAEVRTHDLVRPCSRGNYRQDEFCDALLPKIDELDEMDLEYLCMTGEYHQGEFCRAYEEKSGNKPCTSPFGCP